MHVNPNFSRFFFVFHFLELKLSDSKISFEISEDVNFVLLFYLKEADSRGSKCCFLFRLQPFSQVIPFFPFMAPFYIIYVPREFLWFIQGHSANKVISFSRRRHPPPSPRCLILFSFKISLIFFHQVTAGLQF